jgi:phage baseplate assembly protein W
VTPTLAGFGFPFRIRAGGVVRAAGLDKVDQDLRHLLGTRVGERVLRRGYGGGAHHRVQDPNDATLGALVAYEIEQALLAHAPNVRLVGPIGLSASEEQLTVVVEYVASPADIVRRLQLTLP